MVETLKTIIGIDTTQYDTLIIIICAVIVLFTFKYVLDLFAYLLKWGK